MRERLQSTFLLLVLAVVVVAGLGCVDRNYNGDEVMSQEEVAQRDEKARRERSITYSDPDPLPVAAVPGPEEDVSVLGLLDRPYVSVPDGEQWCVEHVEGELLYEFVIDHELTAASPAPEDLQRFLEDRVMFPFERYEHRWFLRDRIVLYTRVRWGSDGGHAAEALSLLRLNRPPGWAIEESGITYRCE